MKFYAIFISLVTLVQAQFLPVEVVARTEADGIVYNCILEETDSVNSSFFSSRRKDDLCNNFRSDLEKMIRVDLEVRLYGTKHLEGFKKFSLKHGANIKILKFFQWTSDEKTTEDDFLEIFALTPNLKNLELREWSDSLNFDDKSPQVLGNLESLTLGNIHSSFFELLEQILPRNGLRQLTIENAGKFSSEAIAQLTSSQKNIQDLKIEGNLKSFDPFKILNLKSFVCHFRSNEKFEEQREVVREMLQSQSQLVELDLIGQDDVSKFLDNELFFEICKLQKLTDFKFNIDGISQVTVYELSNMKSLKKLSVKSNNNKDLDENARKFNHLSMVHMPGLEELGLMLSSPLLQRSYRKHGQNHENLKSLAISQNVFESLNFFMQIFPNLENLSLNFGSGLKGVSFEESYEDDGIIHQNIKSLKLIFTKTSIVSPELFMKMVNVFPKVENLEIESEFEFTQNFMENLLNSPGNVKKLALRNFNINCTDEISEDFIQILQKFHSRLDKFNLSFQHIKQRGNLETCYKNLIEAVKDVFYLRYATYSHFITAENLDLIGGKKIE